MNFANLGGSLITTRKLAGNGMTDTGIGHLAMALARNGTVKHIDLRNGQKTNRLTVQGLHSFVVMLAQSESIESVELDVGRDGEQVDGAIITMLEDALLTTSSVISFQLGSSSTEKHHCHSDGIHALVRMNKEAGQRQRESNTLDATTNLMNQKKKVLSLLRKGRNAAIRKQTEAERPALNDLSLTNGR